MGRKTDDLARTLVGRLRDARLDTYLVAAFTGGKPTTVTGWVNKNNPPRGLMLNGLQVLLYVLGVESPEFLRVTQYGQYLARLMAFQLVSLEKAQEFIGAGYPQAVFETIRGERDPYDEDVAIRPTISLEELQQRFDGSLTAAEEKLRKRFENPETTPGDIVRDAGGVQQGTPAAMPTMLDHGGLVALIASRIGEVRPLAQYLLDECSPEDRARVRELLGEEGVFDLSNLFNALCSERARDAYLGR